MTKIADASQLELARAIHMGLFAWALEHGTTPAVLEARLSQVDARLALKAAEDDEAAPWLELVREQLLQADDQDADITQLKAKISLSLEEINGRPQLYQSFSMSLICPGLVVVLAILSKIKYKNKNWEIKEGFPDLKDILDKLTRLSQD